MRADRNRRWSLLTACAVAIGLGSFSLPAADAGEPRLLVTDESSVRLLSTTGHEHRVVAAGGLVGEADSGPGGRQIAYSLSTCARACVAGWLPHQAQLRVVNADGSADRALLTLPVSYIWSVDWSSDGRWIAFLSAHGVTCWGCPIPWTLNVYDPVDRVHLVLGPADDIDWSPDGRQIAFAHAGAIHVIEVIAGAVPRRVSATKALAHSPRWSPDGRLLAFHRSGGTSVLDAPRVWVVRPDGSGARALDLQTWSDISWSPDGRAIAAIEGSSTIRIARTDGSRGRVIRLPVGWAYQVAWSPDGRSMAYTHDPAGGGWRSVRLIRVDGTGDREIYRSTNWLHSTVRWT